MTKYGIAITAIFIWAAIFIGCSKEIIRTETCFDGILNNGETEIDCGGHCKSCTVVAVPVVPPCTPVNNKVTFGSTLTASVYGMASSGQYVVSANTSQFDLDITFPSEPTADRIYTVSPNCPTSFLGPNECCMVITAFNLYYPPDGASVYVNIVNGQKVITYCNVPFSGPSTVNSTAKLTCP
jgi:hypothetical protein